MATLVIEFNCMCVFVPDEDNQVVHVLMPTTQGHGHDHPGGGEHPDGGVEQHVVRILHPSLPPKGISMERWALVLGGDGAAGSADTSLEPAKRIGDATLVDLSARAGRTVPRSRVGDAVDEKVNARVTLRAGRLGKLESEVKWRFVGEDIVPMAFRATWIIEDAPEGELEWVRLGAEGDPPLERLAALGSPNDDVFRFSVYHVPDRALPPDPADLGRLTPDEVQDHFRALYSLLDIDDPGDHLLPTAPPETFGTAHCGGGRASLAPAGG